MAGAGERRAGKKGPSRDIVALNAGFAIAASGVAAGPKQGIALAQAAIDSGKALEKLKMLVEETNRQALLPG